MTNGSGGQEWAADVVRAIGQAMKEARGGGKTAAWLSRRTEELGYRVSPTILAKLESGHRGEILNIPELLIIAAALNVPPLSLLFPNVLEETQLLPGKTLPGLNALGWFTGTGDDGQQAAPAMQIALQLVANEKSLMTQRHNLVQHERVLELESTGGISMDSGMKAYEEKNAEYARRQIEFLESDRERLTSLYGRLVSGEFDA